MGDCGRDIIRPHRLYPDIERQAVAVRDCRILLLAAGKKHCTCGQYGQCCFAINKLHKITYYHSYSYSTVPPISQAATLLT